MVKDPVIREALVGLADMIRGLSATLSLSLNSVQTLTTEQAERRREDSQMALAGIATTAERIKAKVLDRS